MRLVRWLICFLLGVSPFFSLSAQQTQTFIAPEAEFRRGLDLFEKQKFVAAQECFDGIVRQATDSKNLSVIDAEYYAAVCALELFHKDAEWRLTKFIEHHPESPKVHRVYFQLGRYHYRKKKYDDAINWFRIVDLRDLQKEELAEFRFKRGYSYFELGYLDSAKTDFFEIRDIDTKYSASANYYYSHIAYTEGNYQTALDGFNRLTKHETFGPVVPFYIAQIYYLQGRYEDVIKFAPPLMDSAKRKPEIAKLIGESYYRTARYKEAVTYFDIYKQGSWNLTREDYYEFGYANYRAENPSAAIPYFQQALTDSADRLDQNAWYHLGDCYVKADNKQAARTAFGKASEMKHDPGIREDALFNYARLSYELSFSPFNEAIVALEQYIKEYPNSSRHDEAYTLLTNVYLSTKNYGKALTSMEKIKTLSPAMRPAHQQVAYNYAVELFNKREYAAAIVNFDKSMTYPMNKDLIAQAYYWKGETWYARAESERDTSMYSKAVAEYKKFLFTPGAADLSNYNTANYNIGYAYHQRKDYKNSVVWFRKYVVNKPENQAERLMDANLRLGDGYLILGDYINASEFYQAAQTTKTPTEVYKDYAMRQHALALGYLGRKKEKVDMLRKLRETYPNSPYVKGASRFDEASTYHDLQMYDEALRLYNEIYLEDPKGPKAMLCQMQMGLIYRTKGDDVSALKAYKMAVSISGGTGDKMSALREIKEIYLKTNRIDEWEKYAESVGFVEATAVSDSTTFEVARRFYSAGNCAEAMPQLNKYVQKYPAGNYITDVQYMRAECAFKSNDYPTAIGAYNAVLDKGKSKYTDRCLIQNAFMYHKQKDYANAIRMYNRLEVESTPATQQDARVNLMKCWVNLGNTDSAAVWANKVVNVSPKPNGDILGQAYWLKGKAALSQGNLEEAKTAFLQVEKYVKNDYAAEARYQLAWIRYQKKEYKTAEKDLFKFINDYAGFAQWKGKGMLLLADNYLALKDTFNAKYVLQDYIDNGDVPELQKEAQAKLDMILLSEQKNTLRKQEEIIVPMGEGEDAVPNQDGGQQ
jgi:tetratricopeptide (TPR) repeat protein